MSSYAKTILSKENSNTNYLYRGLKSVLTYMSVQDKFVLTFTKNDLTLVEIYTIDFCSDTQIKVEIVQVNINKKFSENVRYPTVFSCNKFAECIENILATTLKLPTLLLCAYYSGVVGCTCCSQH